MEDLMLFLASMYATAFILLMGAAIYFLMKKI